MKKQFVYYILAGLLVLAAVLSFPALSSEVRSFKANSEVSAKPIFGKWTGKKKPKKTNKQKRKYMYRPGARQN